MTLQVAVELTRVGDGAHVRFESPSPESSDATGFVERAYRRLAAATPPPRRAQLRVEVGWVEDRIERRGAPTVTSSRPYAIAVCGGDVWRLGEAEPAWCGIVEPNDVPRDSLIVLGPTAVLTLAAGLLADAAAGELGIDWSALAGLTLLDVAESPYPPHEIPVLSSLDAHAEVLVQGGIFLQPPERSQEELSPLGALTAPWRWSDGGMLSIGYSRNLAVLAAAAPTPRAPYVVIDAWQAANDHWGGVIEVDAEISLVETSGARRAGARPLRFPVDIPLLLRGAAGAAAAPLPAIDQHPILGERFGCASPLVVEPNASALFWTR